MKPRLSWFPQRRQWRICLARRWHYLGPDEATAEDKARLLLADHISRRSTQSGPSVATCVDAINSWASSRYARTRAGSEADAMRAALAWLSMSTRITEARRGPRWQCLPSLPASDLTALHVAAVQDAMMRSGRARSYVNGTTRRIQQAWAQARMLGLVPAETVADVRLCRPIPAGHQACRDTAPVAPAKDSTLDAILPHCEPHVAALVGLLRHSGMRPGEAVEMRVCDLDCTGPIWRYSLGTRHKTGRASRLEKVVWLGARAQAAIQPMLDAARATMRTDAPLFPSQSTRNRHGSYSRDSLLTAIKRACRAAGVPEIHTHQLRHTAATKAVEREALKAAQAILGHASQSSSRIYAELDRVAMEQARLHG